MNSFHPFDIGILLAYLAILIFIGWISGRKKNESTAEHFFLTSGTLPWYAIGFSIIASGISSEQFIGTVGFAYQYGLPVANWEWLNGPSIILLAFIFIPVYFRWKIVTMPQFLEVRFNARVRSIFAIITLITYVFINLAGVVFSGGFALQTILGIDLYTGIWALTILAGFFVIYGGLESVAWTNVFQGATLLGGGLLIFIMGLIKVPGGLTEILGEGERSHVMPAYDHPVIPVTSLLVLAFSTNVWFFCTNQTINQAALGARNLRHAKLGVLFAGFLGILIAFGDVFPGLIAYALNPDLPVADAAFPYVVSALVPIGLRGLVLAGLLGAILSTIESIGNAAATIFTFDIYKPVRPNASEKDLVKAGRIAALITLIIGGLWAPVVMQFGHIFSYFQECWAFIAIPVVVIFVLGIFWRGMTAKAAFWTLLLSFPMLLLPYLLRLLDFSWNVYNVAGIVFIGTFIFAVVVSLATQSATDTHHVFSWRDKDIDHTFFEKYLPFIKSPGFWALILIGIYIFTYAYFW